MVDAREYHERTKHSPRDLRRQSFSLDWSNKPRPYKRYTDRPRLDLPERIRAPRQPALSAIAHASPDPHDRDGGTDGGAGGKVARPGALDLQTLATVCYYAAGVTKAIEHDGQAVPYRAASCTGKLYHVDLYLVCGDLPGLDAGVYHFDPRGYALDVLREGDYRGVLADAAGSPAVAGAPVTVVATSEWWRNAWKYRERTYRHAFWDSGTILANLLATVHSLDRRAEVVTGFADAPVADLPGLDPETEAPLELVALDRGAPAPDAPEVAPIAPETVPLCDERVEYPLNHDAWAQSTLDDGDAAREWREPPVDDLTRAAGDGERIALDPVDAGTASARPLGRTIRRRGSARAYERRPISRRMFGTVLDRALRGLPADATGEGLSLNDCYCLVHAVEDVPAGAYHYHPSTDELERIGDTDRETAAHLALDQGVVGETAASVYFLADLDAVVERLGNRGYRLAQLEAGVALGRLYLATYAHRVLGGRGFTFYDDLVTDHLSPRAAGQTPTCLYALGRPER